MPLLQIDIEARYAKFQDALTSMERQTKKSAANMQSAFSGVKSTLAGLGIGLGVGALVGIVKSSIDAADHLNDLSKKTGVAVSVLGGLGFAAEQAGGDLESVAAAAGKLNKSLAAAAGGDKELIAAFKAINVEIFDVTGALKTADQVIPEIADRFAQFADGPGKAALALKFFSKAGADMIPLLNDGGQALRDNIEYYQKYAGITAEVAQKADQFNDTLVKIKLLSGAAGRTITAELLGPLNEVSQAMLDAKEKSTAFETIGKGLATAFEALVILGANVAFVFKTIGAEIGGTAAQLNALAHGDFKGFSQIGDAMEADAKKARAELDEFEKRILNSRGAAQAQAPAKPGKKKVAAPIIPGAAADNPAVRILEGQLKALERASQAERDLLAARSDFLQSYYQDDLVAISQYYDGLRAAQDEALQATKVNIDKEIALLKASKPADARAKADRDSRVQELQERRAALVQSAGREAIKLGLEEDRAAKAFLETLASINAELLEQQGLLPQAAAARFDQANDQIKKRLTAERDNAMGKGDTAGAAALTADIARLGTLRNLTIAQARLNSLSEIGGRVQSDLSAATERAQIGAITGATTETEALRIVSDARLQAVADLQKVATAFDSVAASSGNPKMIEQAKAMQLEVEKLAASADQVRAKFADAFAGSFESAIERLASGTATLKDVFKGLLSDITSEITKIAAHDFSKQLFSSKGALGGAVDFVSGLFGGAPSAVSASADVTGSIAKVADSSGAVAANAALASLALTVPTTELALGALSLAADSAALALSTVAGTGGVGAAGGLIGLLAAADGRIFVGGNATPFAKGGIPGIVNVPTHFPMRDGGVGLMGEAGPEAIMPLSRGKGGALSVTMLDAAGKATLLPVTRDGNGRMAVRAFASGAAFSRGMVNRDPNLVVAGGVAAVAAAGSDDQGGTTVHVHVTPPAGSSAASASQWGATAGRQIQASLRRNG